MTDTDFKELILKAFDDLRHDVKDVIGDLKTSVSPIPTMQRDIAEIRRTQRAQAERIDQESDRTDGLVLRAAKEDAVEDALSEQAEDEKQEQHFRRTHRDAWAAIKIGAASTIIGAIVGAVVYVFLYVHIH